ncbi:MAG: hypothetical protein Q8R16_01135, partial [bacterium]|nr:hypothetical protein [bacterium]
MGRRRTKRQRGGQDAHRDAVFTDHVPVGRKPCSWCCGAQSGLAVGAGFFRDTDIDFGSGRYGVCCNCAGTGVELGISKDVRDELMRCRFERSNILDWRVPRLEQAAYLADVIAAGRTNVTKAIDRAIAVLDTEERGETAQRALVLCAKVLDALFWREEFEDRYGRALQHGLDGDRRQQYRDRLVSAREAVCVLVPEMGTVECQQLTTALAPHATRCLEELFRVQRWANDPLPYEELKLLLLVRCYWLEAGRPTGCYAERLVQILEDLLNPPPAPRRVIAPEAAARFQSPEFPVELEGLDGALLADLHDCVSRFGGEDHTDRVRRASLHEPTEVHVCVSTVPGNRT